MKVSGIVFVAYLVPWKIRKSPRLITSYFDRENWSCYTKMDYEVKVAAKKKLLWTYNFNSILELE